MCVFIHFWLKIFPFDCVYCFILTYCILRRGLSFVQRRRSFIMNQTVIKVRQKPIGKTRCLIFGRRLSDFTWNPSKSSADKWETTNLTGEPLFRDVFIFNFKIIIPIVWCCDYVGTSYLTDVFHLNFTYSNYVFYRIYFILEKLIFTLF